MKDTVVALLRENRLERGHYAEPYAGGCGLALSLLFDGYVSDIHINDIDRAIWAFLEVGAGCHGRICRSHNANAGDA